MTIVMKKRQPIKEASPALWRKFNSREQKYWKLFFQQFKRTIPHSMGGDKDLSKERIEVISHNLACDAVWVAKDMLIKK